MIGALQPLELTVYFLIAINFIAFAVFGVDKLLAEMGSWRISEATLLMWAFFGGTLGAYAGRSLFRHKTRKQPFSRQLNIIAGLQAVVLIFGTVIGWGNVFALIQNLVV